MKKQTLMGIILLVIIAGLAAASYFLLPDPVVTSLTGPAPGAVAMDKTAVISVISTIGAAAAVLSFIVSEKKGYKDKCFFIAWLAAAVFVLLLYINCLM